MKKLLIPLLLIMASCTDKVGAKKALERNNYKVLEIGGHDYFTESKDIYQTKFKAVAPNGDTVTGTVSKGLLKGSTIRLNN
jgi:hypothetical protein